MSEEATFFPSAGAFRRWLEAHHDERQVLWVGLYKKGTRRPTMTWDQAVDEALCFGWIDGMRKGVDDLRYKIRFTPRREGSGWSRKNVASVERLSSEGRMMSPGLRAFEARRTEGLSSHSFRREDDVPFSTALRKTFEASPEAWERFKAQPPGYRKTMRRWVMSAKGEETRHRRLDRLIDVSGRGNRVDLLSPFTQES